MKAFALTISISTPGNPYTPRFAGLADKFVNFGPAASTGNCSSYSNVLLRYGVSRQDITGGVNKNPSLWEYAKRSGYRTVFIDAQAGNISNAGLMQNFMTMQEKSQIDGFYAIRDIPGAEADGKLADIITKELAGDKPVFIYANKNGAHFPYDHAYPAEAGIFHPTMGESGVDSARRGSPLIAMPYRGLSTRSWAPSSPLPISRTPRSFIPLTTDRYFSQTA